MKHLKLIAASIGAARIERMCGGYRAHPRVRFG